MKLLRTLPPLEAQPVIGIAVTLVRDIPTELYDELVRHPYEVVWSIHRTSVMHLLCFRRAAHCKTLDPMYDQRSLRPPVPQLRVFHFLKQLLVVIHLEKIWWIKAWWITHALKPCRGTWGNLFSISKFSSSHECKIEEPQLGCLHARFVPTHHPCSLPASKAWSPRKAIQVHTRHSMWNPPMPYCKPRVQKYHILTNFKEIPPLCVMLHIAWSEYWK